jgi:hypothetical protein
MLDKLMQMIMGGGNAQGGQADMMGGAPQGAPPGGGGMMGGQGLGMDMTTPGQSGGPQEESITDQFMRAMYANNPVGQGGFGGAGAGMAQAPDMSQAFAGAMGQSRAPQPQQRLQVERGGPRQNAHIMALLGGM